MFVVVSVLLNGSCRVCSQAYSKLIRSTGLIEVY